MSRDRGRQRERDAGGSRAQSDSDRASKQHRAALEALFAKGEVGKLIEKMSARPEPARPPEPAPAETPPAAAPAQPRSPTPAASSADPNSRTALRKKILEAIGRDQISRAVDRFVELHGLPGDFEVLAQCLEHNREERVQAALALLADMLVKDKPRRSRALIGKLRFLEETSPNSEIRAQAAQNRAKLG